MTHLNEEELIELHYGESSSGEHAAHLRSCQECSARYARLQQELEAIPSTPVPWRGVDYGERVWQQLRPSLPACERPQRSWFRRMPWMVPALTAACALLIAGAFVGGRYWERHMAQPAKIAGGADAGVRQRVVLVVLTDHLDRTERLLVALQHANPSDAAANSQLQTEARELLVSNRLYRTTAGETGDPALASALDQLERVLAEVANDPAGLDEADLRRVRETMNSEGILFEIRVLLSRGPNQTTDAGQKKGASI